MSRFITTLLVIIAIWYLFKFIGRILFPYLLDRFAKRMMNNFGFQNQDKIYEEEKEREGEIKIDYTKKTKGKESIDEGEYVDFEEVD